jgi:hypothetical protein
MGDGDRRAASTREPGAAPEAAGGDRPRFDLSVWALIAANVVPLAGVLFLGWDAGVILLLYWAENLIIGGYSVLRILFAASGPPVSHIQKVLLVPFFAIHYGGFCAVHGIFVSIFVGGLGGGAQAAAFPDHDQWPGPLVFVGLLVGVVRHFWDEHGEELLWPLVALALSHGISFVQNFIVRGEHRSAGPKALMAAPYGRILLLHVALIVGGLPVLLLGSPLPLVAILVVFKVVADVFLHARSHGARGPLAGVAR